MQSIPRELDYIRVGIKHFFKSFIGKRDEKWDFYNFEMKINKKTWGNHDEILKWAEEMSSKKGIFEKKEGYIKSQNQLVRQGYNLRKTVLAHYREKYKNKYNLKFILHIPPANESPAGYSLLSNMADGLEFMGINVGRLSFSSNIQSEFDESKKNIVLAIQCDDYLSRIDWNFLRKYKGSQSLCVGIFGSPKINGEKKDNNKWKEFINFYCSYDDLRFCEKKYEKFFNEGHCIIGIPFGANVLKYYSIPNIEKDLDYVFLASRNRDKWNRYVRYLSRISREYIGLISGPGWNYINMNEINANRDRYIYARSKVGLNLHINYQIEAENQLNERTYMLAACGVPQVIDNPAILPYYFSKDSFFIAKNPGEYYELFRTALENGKEAEKRALKAQKEVFFNHTTFHRMDIFIKDLNKYFLLV